MPVSDQINHEIQHSLEHRTDEAAMRLALDAARMGTWERNLLTGEDFWSVQEEALFGLAPGTFGTTHVSFLDLVHPQDRSRIEESVRKAIDGSGRYDSEFRIIKPDGTVRWMVGRGDVIRDASGHATHMIGVTMDITDLKEANEQVRLAKEQAEAANAAKDHFLAVLSHELRTPLSPVLTSVEMLGRLENLPAEVAASLDTIRRNVQMEARIIDDLLDLTRISRGKIELRAEAVDAHASACHALEVWQQLVEEKAMKVSLELKANRHHVRADPARLQQVFWNLIGNAVKFTPAGGHITLRSSNTPENQLVFEVSDTGIGIDADLLPRVFNAFEQGERAVTRRYGGLGLGLSISKALIEMHHGCLTVASAGTGKGATFTLTLDTIAPPTGDLSTIAKASVSPAKARRILLVEDHEDTLRVMAHLLRCSGHAVSTAASVRAALDILDNQTFELIISDLGLPDGSGLELIRQAKAKRPIRSIALSGFGMDEDVQRSLEAGFDVHLTKPVNLGMLESAIRGLTECTA